MGFVAVGAGEAALVTSAGDGADVDAEVLGDLGGGACRSAFSRAEPSAGAGAGVCAGRVGGVERGD